MKKITKSWAFAMTLTFVFFVLIKAGNSQNEANPQALGAETGKSMGTLLTQPEPTEVGGEENSEEHEDSDFKKGVNATGSGIKKGAKATGRGFKKAGRSIKHFFSGDKDKK